MPLCQTPRYDVLNGYLTTDPASGLRTDRWPDADASVPVDSSHTLTDAALLCLLAPCGCFLTSRPPPPPPPPPFADDTLQKRKPLTCVDVNAAGRFLCAGTEVVDQDAYLVFWDVRQSAPLGGYWESHTDELSTVSQTPHSEATGSRTRTNSPR